MTRTLLVTSIHHSDTGGPQRTTTMKRRRAVGAVFTLSVLLVAHGFQRAATHRSCRQRTCLSMGQQPIDRRHAIISIALLPSIAHAGLPEVDASGSLYTPRPQMLSGGSDAARGIAAEGRRPLREGQVFQTIYETRFIAYLSRFLLNFDPSAHAWWIQQGFGDTWIPFNANSQPTIAFAEFAESVEVGLADYFTGPYGSYSSLAAMRAGMAASQPAKSRQSSDTRQSKVGILNLYTLLKARYNTIPAKRQLANLFSMISAPELQPVNEIRSLLGEVDNATVSRIELIKPPSKDFRRSSRQGGGYSSLDNPQVSIEAPPALGSNYRPAKIEAQLRPTSRVLRITVVDGGCGYEVAPSVTVVDKSGFLKQCQATSILNRHGSVESILVLDPGFGYGGFDRTSPPRVFLEKPREARKRKKGSTSTDKGRRAKAVAELEYEIVGLDLVHGGNGFVATEPPQISMEPPPQDPDWFLDTFLLSGMARSVEEVEPLKARVTQMKYQDGNVAYSNRRTTPPADLTADILDRVQRDPLELLPSPLRPRLIQKAGKNFYEIPTLSMIPQSVAKFSPQFRAVDPVFGAVGRVPVMKGAKALSASEYGRLALSGAVCTVVVRTLLNPLELVKTKQQLGTDEVLLQYARESLAAVTSESKLPPEPSSPPIDELTKPGFYGERTQTLARPDVGTEVLAETSLTPAKTKLGAFDVIRSSIELRGPQSLFQSADITFLASLVFGSFGFGATELFRRSFAGTFQPESSGQGSEVILLLAAAVATVLTSAVASPFEVLRVRSMGELEARSWTKVLQDFIVRTSTAIVT